MHARGPPRESRAAKPETEDTYHCHVRPFLVVIKEESQVLVRNVHIRVSAQLPVQLLSLLAAREPVLVDLVLDLVRRVRHEYTRVRVRRAHLRLRALQRGEELGVDQRRLRVLELRRDVPR